MGESRQGFSCCLLLEGEAHSFISALKSSLQTHADMGCLLLPSGLHRQTSVQTCHSTGLFLYQKG